MTEEEKLICTALGNIKILPGTWAKRFCRQMCSLVKDDPAKELSEKQKYWIYRMLHTYRKQLPNTYQKFKDKIPELT